MRRWMAALAATVTLAVATGCGNPAGVDGMLTDDWPELPAAVGFVPEANVCHEYSGNPRASSYRPVDCAERHMAETVRVGTFPATVTVLPDDGTEALFAAFAECDRAAREWLGGDWREAPLGLNVVVPDRPAWAGGARWYRCDLSRRSSLGSDNSRPGTGSLKGALASGAEPRHECFVWTKDTWDTTPTPCDKPHDMEFVGIHETKIGWEALIKGDDSVYFACWSLVARYAKVPDDDNLGYRTSVFYFPPTLEEWSQGSRAVRCMAYIEDGLSRSIRGGGTSALPIR